MPNSRGLNRTLGVAIAAIGVFALASGAVSLLAMQQRRAASQAERRSENIILGLSTFETSMLNQETGVRGFLLTGKSDSLAPYFSARPRFDAITRQLRVEIGSDPQDLPLFNDAEAAARNWQREIGEPIAAAANDPTKLAQARAIEASGLGKARFDTVRAKRRLIVQRERAALDAQAKQLAGVENLALAAVLIGSALTVTLCVIVGLALNRLVTRPLVRLADVMARLARRDLTAEVEGAEQRNEVGLMARAVQVFKDNLLELDRTALLRTTTDTLPAMIGYVDADRRLGFINSEFTRWFDLGVQDVSEVRGRPLGEAFAATAFPGAGAPLEAALQGREARFEQVLRRRDGDQRDLDGYFRPHLTPDGRVLGAVTLLTDVTERKEQDRRLTRQAQDLMRMNEELEQFAYVASHDLKAPLRGIENLVSWIEEDLESSLTGDTRTNMDLLKNRVRRLESLLDDLLAYSRAGRDAAPSDEVDTLALVGELTALLSPPADFEIVAAPSLPILRAPRAALTQVLQNLIGNAIKHRPADRPGRVIIEAREQEGQFEFTVTDNGSGIPEQFRSRVFGMFQTLKPRDEVEGSGMGLAIVKKIIERQGGMVWLTDGPSGAGLAVHFTWPSST